MLALATPLASERAAAQGVEVAGEAPCYRTPDQARRLNFVAAFQAAHVAAAQAACGLGDAAQGRRRGRLDSDLGRITRLAQLRNPDVDLTTTEARYGTDVCRFTPSDREIECRDVKVGPALTAYGKAMATLRTFTASWQRTKR